MNRGYIKFWRKAQDSSSWNRGLMYQGLIINLLTRAAWKKSSYQGREILPGQFGAVMSNLSESLGVPRSTLQRMVAHLEEDGLMEVKNVGNRFVIITIINWHSYQESEKEPWAADGQPAVNQRAAGGQPYYKEEEVKKGRIRQESSYEDSSPELAGLAAGVDPLEISNQAEPMPEASLPACVSPPLDIFIALPLNTGQEHPITVGEIEQWADLYPAADVPQELRNMRGWLLGNPKRRKTKQGIGRFVQSWLAKAQDGAHGVGLPKTRDGPGFANRIGISAHGNSVNDREREHKQTKLPDYWQEVINADETSAGFGPH